MKIVIASAAEAELREAILHYRSIFLDLGARFFHEYERSPAASATFQKGSPQPLAVHASAVLKAFLMRSSIRFKPA